MIDKLNGKLPQAVLNELPLVMDKFGISNPTRLAHFLSQVAHESGNFKFIKENLNYSSKGLINVFKKYFTTETLALAVNGGTIGLEDRIKHFQEYNNLLA